MGSNKGVDKESIIEIIDGVVEGVDDNQSVGNIEVSAIGVEVDSINEGFVVGDEVVADAVESTVGVDGVELDGTLERFTVGVIVIDEIEGVVEGNKDGEVVGTFEGEVEGCVVSVVLVGEAVGIVERVDKGDLVEIVEGKLEKFLSEYGSIAKLWELG